MCWYDVELLYEQLKTRGIQKVLVLPEGGEEISALLRCGAQEIVVVESQESQRALVELKVQGMRHLRASGLQTLLGLNPAGRRVFLYHQMRPLLSQSARSYWDRHEESIRTGILEGDNGLPRSLFWMGFPRSKYRWSMLGAHALGAWIASWNP
ncbi:MAG: DUF3419 family protein, partial [Myxococcota bacterium]|nr:DUF3419 family protein [Myxococcota bacterium]